MTAPIHSESYPRARPIGLHAIIGMVALVAVIGLLLVAFYKPFPTVTVLNASEGPIQNLVLQTLGSETHGETHELGSLEVGESGELTVRSYEVTVLAMTFELNGKPFEHKGDPFPITQGQTWRMTVGPGGEVTGSLDY